MRVWRRVWVRVNIRFWDEVPYLETVFADAAYQGALEDCAAEALELLLQIVPKLEGQSTSAVLPKR